jgi:hypothetical protein
MKERSVEREFLKKKFGTRMVHCSLTSFSDVWPKFVSYRAGKSVFRPRRSLDAVASLLSMRCLGVVVVFGDF